MNASDFESELSRRLAAIREQGLYRELRRVDGAQGPHIRIAGQELLNFSSNDYLGLANEPAVKAAAERAVVEYGAGAGASRLICGSLAVHHRLDEALAEFKGVPGALSFSTGYGAALGAIGALLGKEDVIVLDKRVHACIVDAARQCGAKMRVYGHNDLADLEAILRWADKRAGSNPESMSRRPRLLIVTESVFSMDGDRAPLREIVALKEKYGAWLMVDEAHATGLYGANRRGLAEELEVSDRIEIQMGTLGKALGSAGGYLCGSRTLVDYLINRARTFIFSTAPVPAAAAAATEAIRLVQSSNGVKRVARLWERVGEFCAGERSFPTRVSSLGHAIIPLMMGGEARAVEVAGALRERGIFIPAIRYPTVARGQARLRLTLTSAHSSSDVGELRAALSLLELSAGQPGLASRDSAGSLRSSP